LSELLHDLDKRVSTHEAVCAERYEAIEKRLDQGAKVMRELRLLIYAIVGLLALGEGSILEVARRLLLAGN
jgi:hypothetical protein